MLSFNSFACFWAIHTLRMHASESRCLLFGTCLTLGCRAVHVKATQAIIVWTTSASGQQRMEISPDPPKLITVTPAWRLQCSTSSPAIIAPATRPYFSAMAYSFRQRPLHSECVVQRDSPITQNQMSLAAEMGTPGRWELEGASGATPPPEQVALSGSHWRPS